MDQPSDRPAWKYPPEYNEPPEPETADRPADVEDADPNPIDEFGVDDDELDDAPLDYERHPRSAEIESLNFDQEGCEFGPPINEAEAAYSEHTQVYPQGIDPGIDPLSSGEDLPAYEPPSGKWVPGTSD